MNIYRNISSGISQLFHLDVSFPEDHILTKGDKTYYYAGRDWDSNQETITENDKTIQGAKNHTKYANLEAKDAYITKIGVATIMQNECGFFAPLKEALKRTYTQGDLWKTPLTMLPLLATPYLPGVLRGMHESFMEQHKGWVGKLITVTTKQYGIETSRYTYRYTQEDLARDRISSIIINVALGIIFVSVAAMFLAIDSLVLNFYNSKLHARQWKVVELNKELTSTAQAFSESVKEKNPKELEGEDTHVPHPTEKRFLTVQEKALFVQVVANEWDESSKKFLDPISSEPIENIWSTKTIRLGKYIIPLNSALEAMLTNTRDDGKIPHPIEASRTLNETEQEAFLSLLSDLTSLPRKSFFNVGHMTIHNLKHGL